MSPEGGLQRRVRVTVRHGSAPALMGCKLLPETLKPRDLPTHPTPLYLSIMPSASGGDGGVWGKPCFSNEGHSAGQGTVLVVAVRAGRCYGRLAGGGQGAAKISDLQGAGPTPQHRITGPKRQKGPSDNANTGRGEGHRTERSRAGERGRRPPMLAR